MSKQSLISDFLEFLKRQWWLMPILFVSLLLLLGVIVFFLEGSVFSFIYQRF